MTTSIFNDIIATDLATVNTTSSGKGVESNDSLADLVLLIINITIGCIGLIGNTFVVVVIVGFTSMYKQIANLFVINQSIIDAVSSLLVIIQMSSSFSPNIVLTPNQFASELYCRMWHSQLLLWAAYAASTYNLVSLTIERYLKLIHAHVHKSFFTPRSAKFLILFVWLFGFLQVSYGIPTTVIIDTKCYTNSLWPNDVIQNVTGYIIIALQYWIPILVFVVAYTKMIRFFRRVSVSNRSGKKTMYNRFSNF